MDAKEIKIKGVQFCKSRGLEKHHAWCDGCPFEDKIMCIDENGELFIHTKTNLDFEDFVRDFNFLIEELNKKGINLT
jgi:hypothetical protein